MTLTNFIKKRKSRTTGATKIPYICPVCAKVFTSKNGIVRKYCSRDCSNISRKGAHHSPETEFKKGSKGKLCAAYKHGKSNELHLLRGSLELINWRSNIFKRDKYTCRLCNKVGGQLEAHHLRSFAYNATLRTDISNGITTCKKCHKGIHKRCGYQKEEVMI